MQWTAKDIDVNSDFLQYKRNLPTLGIGLGYRAEIAAATLRSRDSIDFLEIITEHYVNVGQTRLQRLHDAADFPLIPHGVSLSIGGTDDLDRDFVKQAGSLFKRINAPWWSDHLCFTGAGGVDVNDLLPLPFSTEAVEHIVKRIKMVQHLVDVPFLLENITAYMRMPGAEMTEAQFITEVVERADCGLLLDVNNVYINSRNLGFDPFEFIDQLPLERVVQIHIAGHRKTGNFLMDTHGARVIEPVYQLLEYTLERTEVKGILLERDQYFPKFSAILSELDKIRCIAHDYQPELVSQSRRKKVLTGTGA